MPPLAAPFAMLYGPVIVDHQITDAARTLYSLLWCLGDRFKQGWHSQRLLADLLHVSTRKVRRGLKNLAEAELIISTVRRPKPTLIQIVDPAEIYGVFMVRFYEYVKDRSAALRQEGVTPPGAKKSNRTDLSCSIGQDCPMKDIKGSREKCADSRPRASVDDSFKRVEKQKKASTKKSVPNRKKKVPGLRIPTKPLSPSRWGGGKFYLYCIQCASIKGVRVRDPDVHLQKAPPRFAREMNYAIEAYRDKGYTKKEFLNLLTMIFEQWADFSKFFKKGQFSVYDLRYAIIEICELERHLSDKFGLEDMEDFEEEEKRPEERVGQVHYDNE